MLYVSQHKVDAANVWNIWMLSIWVKIVAIILFSVRFCTQGYTYTRIGIVNKFKKRFITYHFHFQTSLKCKVYVFVKKYLNI